MLTDEQVYQKVRELYDSLTESQRNELTAMYVRVLSGGTTDPFVKAWLRLRGEK